ncbi:tetraspanin-8-like [Amaranthus tricolor]|uniref:tetraspanin-8-like n=1 Tax=Amaranthus tricolor TaxID=29722 RepID=UPI002586F4C3|nr:tetraspanin-8-like [Amaranthus tricolor]
MGFCGSFFRISLFLWIYIVGLFLALLAWFTFTIFLLLVTNKDAGDMVSKIRVGEHTIGNYYNDWVQHHVVNGYNWEGVRKFCLVESQICHSLPLGNLTTIQSSCCKPPTLCKFTANSTYWEGPPSSMESDCKTWSNDEDKLCYNCKSCKASVEAKLRKKWPLYFSINFIILAIMFLIHNISFWVVFTHEYGLLECI